MNQLKKLFIYRQARLEDLPKIMKFIKDFWRSDHILANDKKFFEYEHVHNNDINFFLAINKNTNSLSAINGFIPYGEIPHCHICSVMIKVNPNEKVPFLGMEVMRYMLEQTSPKTYCGVGTDPKTMLPLVKRFFKRYVGIMDHFCFINKAMTNFKIVEISKKKFNILKNMKNINGISLSNIKVANKSIIIENYNKLFFEKNLPQKSLKYILKRYTDHPVYNYENYTIYDPGTGNKSLIFTREVNYLGSKALRIIDFVGDINVLGKLSEWLKFIVLNNNYEYVDLLCNGIEKTLLTKSGLINKKDNFNIVPTYFEPFIKQNIDIHFEKSHKELILFKGESDGDRPNISKRIVS